MGIGPIAAVPKALKYAGMELKDIDLIELNEAFAAQALAVVRTLEMDEEKVNVNGGAIALGHPLGCTGAKLTVQMIHELQRQGNACFAILTETLGAFAGAPVTEDTAGREMTAAAWSIVHGFTMLATAGRLRFLGEPAPAELERHLTNIVAAAFPVRR